MKFRTYPIDFTLHYRFDDTRWKPYIGAGARYVAAPHVDSMFGYTNRLTPEVVGGVVFQMRHLGIFADGKVNLGDHEYYDPVFKTAIGVSWILSATPAAFRADANGDRCPCVRAA